MARRPSGSGAPSRSRKSITHVVAYARKATTDDTPGEGEAATSDDAPVEAKPADGSITSPGGLSAEALTPAAGAPIPEAPEPAKVEKEAPKRVAPPPPVVATAPTIEEPALGPIYEPLPRPKEIPVEDPEIAAPPPGPVPRGDSRSLRRKVDAIEEFVLIYRSQTFVISRSGTVGKRGRWKVVEYPTMGHASHAYAQECSRLVAQGFADLRE